MDSNVTFLHWLAGLIDGEGCFFARFYPQADGRMPLTLRAEITLRADDREVLEDIRRNLGLGAITYRPSRGTNWSATVTWRVSGREDCQLLVQFLDQAPLRSKKKRDYMLWRDIVALYAQFKRGGVGARAANDPLIQRITLLTEQLREARTYAP